MKNNFFARGLFSLLLMALTASTFASGLQVWPTKVVIAAERGADGLKLLNNSKQPLHAQVRVFRWSQVNGEDVLEPTRELAVSPPMLELAPGTEQLVRVVRLGPPPMDTEASYRLIVDELPLKENSTSGTGLQYVLRYSLPIFLTPHQNTQVSPVLHTRLTRSQERLFLEVDNMGNGHAQVADLTLVTAAARQPVAPGLSGYILPGQRQRWPLAKGLSLPAEGVFTARINGEATERTLAPVASIQ